jgi:hypothetical protein
MVGFGALVIILAIVASIIVFVIGWKMMQKKKVPMRDLSYSKLNEPERV